VEVTRSSDELLGRPGGIIERGKRGKWRGEGWGSYRRGQASKQTRSKEELKRGGYCARGSLGRDFRLEEEEGVGADVRGPLLAR
jgi:hypothetical protein